MTPAPNCPSACSASPPPQTGRERSLPMMTEMTSTQQRAVDVAAAAIAKDSNWQEGTADYDQAVDLAVVAVHALSDAGLLLLVDDDEDVDPAGGGEGRSYIYQAIE